MRIYVVTPLFTRAGVPLAQARLARALARRGHQVTFVIGHLLEPLKIDVSEAKVVVLERWNVRAMLVPLMKMLKDDPPDVIFSAEDHLNAVTLLAAVLTGSKAKISCSSRVTPFDTYSNQVLSKRWFLKQVMKCTMWRADALTCVSKDMVEQYKSVFPSGKHVDVYNIVVDDAARRQAAVPIASDWFSGANLVVAAGRLAPWKGFSDLISAFSKVVRNRSAKLLILGDGPLRQALQKQIDVEGLADLVKLHGYVDNPLQYFAVADVFVLSSHVEGLPNVLVEAMMCGCTPVATDCPTGPREVLQGGRIGYLVRVGDTDAMATAIIEAFDNPVSKASLFEAIEPFEENAVIERHFTLLGL